MSPGEVATGGTNPAAVAKGHAAFRDLLDEMHENRVKRLHTAGFSRKQADSLSELHTPNFM